MSRKVLLTAGCSFLVRSWDDELKGKPSQRSVANEELTPVQLTKLRLSSLLAVKLGRIDINLAKSGSNNRAIINNVVRYIYTHRGTNIHVLLGLTDPSRTQLTSTKDPSRFLQIVGGQILEPPDLNIEEFLPGSTIEDVRETVTRYYAHMYNDFQEEENLISDIIMLNSFCKFYNVNITFFSSITPGNNLDAHKYDNLFQTVKRNSEIDFFNFNLNDRLFSWRHFISTYDSEYKGNHPTLYDNERLTELLYKHINDTYST